MQALFGQRGLASAGVDEVGVTAIDDDVALFEQRDQRVDDRVNGAAGLDHDQHAAGSLEACDQLFHGLGADEFALVAVGLQQCVGLGDRAVVQGDGVSVAGEVPGEVCAHDG
ncbi:hypothetical protein B879_04259 [Cecembia lonarensis LW9]|uniref:Uncharacterized protein n=1 Tax=Cecembia lonarensis (strain CCUG 58316 / KCTC 22772 / LW9) TaxID=1225176 RepID=K1L9R3_CECL9|nr:hypothetical protein B879_04259 [Cecembia lonarensis LW9]